MATSARWAGPSRERVGLDHRVPVALVRVDRDDLDHRQPRPGHGGHPGPQVAGVSTLEHIEDLPALDVDHRGDQAASTAPWAGCITVSSKPTIGVGPTRAGSSTRRRPTRCTADHTVDHDTAKSRPSDAGVAWIAAIWSVAHSAARLVRTRRGSANSAASVQVRTDLAVRIRTRPDALTPPHPHRPIPSRGVAQGHPPAVLGYGTRAAARAPHHPGVGLHIDPRLDPIQADLEHLETTRAEPLRARTTVAHGASHRLMTVEQSRDSWRPPPRWTLTTPSSQLRWEGPVKEPAPVKSVAGVPVVVECDPKEWGLCLGDERLLTCGEVAERLGTSERFPAGWWPNDSDSCEWVVTFGSPRTLSTTRSRLARPIRGRRRAIERSGMGETTEAVRTDPSPNPTVWLPIGALV
jgi:hypothetical protein